MKPSLWALAGIGLAFVCSPYTLPIALGELVYDQLDSSSPQVNSAPQGSAQAPAQRVSPTEERENLRKVIRSSEKARNTVENRPPVQIFQAPVQTLRAEVEVENLSKAELLRRERLREELRNEDILQTRMEELRLEDEKRRTDQILGITPAPAGSNATVPQAGAPLQGQTLVQPPQTERPGVVTTQDQLLMTQAAPQTSTAVKSDKNEERLQVMVGPRAGISGISDSGGYRINGRGSVGVGVGVGVSENLSVELGYQYSTYGVEVMNSNPFFNNYSYYNNFYGYNGGNTNEPIEIRQNVFDIGAKVHLLGQRTAFRPFLGAGLGYGRSFVNYDEDILGYWQQSGINYLGNDLEIDQYLGSLSAGFDLAMGKAVLLGMTFKYYNVFNSRRSSNFNSNSFAYPGYYGYYNGYNPYGFYYDQDKQAVGDSFEDSGFYSLQLGLSFVF